MSDLEKSVSETETQDVLPITAANGDGTVETTRVAEAREAIKMVRYTRIKIGGMNPRDAKKYAADGPAGEKARSLHKHGLKTSLVVSERDNGDMVLLCGHLRYYGIGLVRTEGLPAIGKGDVWPAIPQDPKFMDEVRCRVFKGLTPAEEYDILMDHKDSTPLDRAELLTAVQAMVRLGYTEQFIAEKLGFQSRSGASFYIRLSKLPTCVGEAFRKYEADPKADGAVKLTDNAVNKLYSNYTADKDADPAALKVGGPKFNALWEEIVSEGSPKRNKALAPKDLMDLAEAQDDSDIRDLLVNVANGEKLKTGQAIERIRVRLEDADSATKTVIVEEGIARTVKS